ncbi:MAG: serine hydrolase [Acetobacteraceae bacterium]
MRIDRRGLAVLGVSMLAAPAIAATTTDTTQVRLAMDKFAALPATASGLVSTQSSGEQWEVAHDPEARMFVGSAVKTFILAETLREVEAGSLSEEMQRSIDDKVRSLVSPVFANLTGTTPLRSVLEAMIAHSDNSATDAALAACGVDKVRALIRRAGLTHTEIPNSTRQLFCYLAGAPYGVDLGWHRVEALQNGKLFGAPRQPLNDLETMASTGREMVRWYQTALTGAYFAKPGTLREFKRILAMADAIALTVPADIAAYGKGGSMDWNGFHCFAFAGQMIANGAQVTFYFTINWTGEAGGVQPMSLAYKKAVSEVLSAAKTAMS